MIPYRLEHIFASQAKRAKLKTGILECMGHLSSPHGLKTKATSKLEAENI